MKFVRLATLVAFGLGVALAMPGSITKASANGATAGAPVVECPFAKKKVRHYRHRKTPCDEAKAAPPPPPPQVTPVPADVGTKVDKMRIIHKTEHVFQTVYVQLPPKVIAPMPRCPVCQPQPCYPRCGQGQMGGMPPQQFAAGPGFGPGGPAMGPRGPAIDAPQAPQLTPGPVNPAEQCPGKATSAKFVADLPGGYTDWIWNNQKWKMPPQKSDKSYVCVNPANGYLTWQNPAGM